MTPYDQATAFALRALLDGAPVPEGCPPEALGPWADTVDILAGARAAGGPDGVHKAFVALTRQSPGIGKQLSALLAGDPDRPEKTQWTVPELYAADFAPPRFLVNDLLPSGLSVLAGRPKVGKSWLALQIAAAVAAGGSVLGEQVEQGRVLYLALEDTPRRLRDRLQKQQVPASAALTFATTWEPLGEAGLVDLMLAADRGYALIVVDTLTRGLGRADPLDVLDMTNLFSSLQRLAARHDLALLLVDHHRKPGMGSADPIDDIFGSTAKAGVVDAAMGLYKVHGEKEAVLKVTGRDLSERELAVRWDTAHFVWTFQGEAQEAERTQRQQEVLDTLATLGAAPLRDIADATGQDRSNMFKRLRSLIASGQIERADERGQVVYRLAQAEG